jgi:fructokinase
MPDAPLYGGIELGGTKTVFAVGTGEGEIIARHTVPTRAPEAVIAEAATFFAGHGRAIASLGVGAFGPIIIDPAASDYGRLCETNKAGWSGFDLVGALAAAVPVPLRLVTDVGAAAVGEARLGALHGTRIGIYLTVGTGIGGAIVAGGEVLPALLHPEMGHIALQRLSADTAPSTCAFHDHCAEGLAAGPAIAARFGASLDHFAPEGAEYDMMAHYLGQFCAQIVLMLSPERIVLGGGVGGAPGLVRAVHRAMVRQLGRYAPDAVGSPDYLIAPALGQDAGITGALMCAIAADRELA